MKYFLYLTFLIQVALSQSPLNDRYHTYDDVLDSLFAWEDRFSNNIEPSNYYPNSGIIYQLQEIGRSTTDDIPIYAVKLSYNANLDEDKPKVLILGQCHAEEILGVEISMELINRFLYPDRYLNDIQTLLGALYSSEIWIVPSHNPEGLGVVHGWYDENDHWLQDITFRKNKTDVDGNGVFDFNPEGYGGDIDGVDLNRNYDFNWIFGDPIGSLDSGCAGNSSYISHYDYYRGESPFSEKEVQAIRDLALEKNFLLSIAYHSSRSGCVQERIIYPWSWDGGKTSPDYDVISTLGQQIAELVPVEVGDGNYHHAASSKPKGNAHDWFYAKTGCIQYLIEVATSNMQPNDPNLIEDTINRNIEGAYHLIRRAAGISINNYPEKFQVTGIVKDANTAEILPDVEVKVLEMSSSILSPRKTDDFGRYRRLLSAGTYTLEFSKFGYETQVIENIIPSSSSITELNIDLIPSLYANLDIALNLPEHHNGEVSILRFLGTKVDTFNLNNINDNNYVHSFIWPKGSYELLFLSEDIFPKSIDINLISNWTLDLDLYWYDVLFSDSFENLNNWDIIYGDWNIENGKLLSQENLTYAPFNPLGPQRINLNSPFNVDELDSDNIAIKLLMKNELEWDNDTLFVDIFNDSDSTNILQIKDQNWSYHNRYINTAIDSESNYYVTIGISPDFTIDFRGLDLDQLDIFHEKTDGCKFGDFNHDGYLDIFDVVSIANYIVGSNLLSGYQQCASDFNEDSYVDLLDIILLVNIILEY